MKEKIIDVAISEFSNFGFKSVTVDDIALKMGVSKKQSILTSQKKKLWSKLVS